MFRFISMSWDLRAPSTSSVAAMLSTKLRARSPEWRASTKTPGLSVWVSGERPESSNAIAIPNASGSILGTLFSSSSSHSCKLVSLSSPEADTILTSTGQKLFSNFWGRYVAFIRGEDESCYSVLRDPTGGLPCYYLLYENITVFFSCVDDVFQLGIVPVSIDWGFVRAFVCHPDLRISQTGISNIYEVLPGERIDLVCGRIARKIRLWKPEKISESRKITNFGRSIEEVRYVTQNCISAWASCYPRLLHLLSGGLDSSIVLHCLSRSKEPSSVSCINYFTINSEEEDERTFARIGALTAQCELIEILERSCCVRLEGVLDGVLAVQPLALPYFACHGEVERNIASERGANGIFQGIGGDQVFYQNPVSLAVTDYLTDYGVDRQLLKTAWQVARMEGESILKVLLGAFAHRRDASNQSPLQQSLRHRKLLSLETIETVRQDRNGVYAYLPISEVAPGKLQHILMMSANTNFYPPLGRPGDPERVYPLLSQPLIELCLGIPTYILTTGGWDRSVARCAFRNDIDPSIIKRRSKGGIDQEITKLLKYNLKFIEELMLDGFLVKEGILDRCKLEQLLAHDQVEFSPEAGELIGEHFNTEVWLRNWMDRVSTRTQKSSAYE